MTEIAHKKTPQDETIYLDEKGDGSWVVGCCDRGDIIRWEKTFYDLDAAWAEYRKFAR